ncbi:MAG: hypothetical protein ACRD6R_03085 [Candidatus Polarisedimenticolia bacterium]
MSNRTQNVLAAACTLGLCALVLACAEPRAGTAPTEAGARKENPARWIGVRHPPLPPGVEWVGGALLDPLEEVEFGIEEVTHHSDRLLWLDVLTHRDVSGAAHWEVLDVLAPPPLRDDQVLVLRDCQLDGHPDTEIVAVAEQTNGRFHTRIAAAWRANRATRRFEKMRTAGITCENTGYGL